MHHEISRLSSLLTRVSKRAIIAAMAVSTAAAAAPLRPNDVETATPIKHVMVIIGENRSFDHIFAAYKPRPGQSVLNLLSEGIIKEDGAPGPNFSKAAQNQAQVTTTPIQITRTTSVGASQVPAAAWCSSLTKANFLASVHLDNRPCY